MKNKNYKAFIVEGESREPQIIENLYNTFFKKSNFKIITIPAGKNIYMLWKQMKEDDFDTDIIEVLRENSDDIKKNLEGFCRDDFSEVFLFFDYDGHQNNLSDDEESVAEDIIFQMLQSFDNETENGKLYISYPMVEALRDYNQGICGNEKDCYCSAKNFGDYKQISATRSLNPEFKKYTFSEWKEIIRVFAMRVSCLFDKKQIISYDEYVEKIAPVSIYEKQKNNILHEEIFILSALPEFILDYFTTRLWNSCLSHTKMHSEGCRKYD